jgi:hypothetical protein
MCLSRSFSSSLPFLSCRVHGLRLQLFFITLAIFIKTSKGVCAFISTKLLDCAINCRNANASSEMCSALSRLLFVFKFFTFEKATQRGQHINPHIAKDQKEMITLGDIYCDSHFPSTRRSMKINRPCRLLTRRGTWCKWRWRRRKRHEQPCRGRWPF